VANYPPEQVHISYLSMAKQLAREDTRCGMNATQRDPSPLAKLAVKAAGAQFIDGEHGFWQSIEADTVVPRIHVPVLLTRTWQDNQTGDRESYLPTTFGTHDVWAIFGNGDHDRFYADVPLVYTSIERFLLYYLKDERNLWPLTPRVQILHELDDAGRPAWVSTLGSWPPPARPLSLYLHPDGSMRTSKAGPDGGGSSYVYPTLSPSAPDSDQFEIYGKSVDAHDPVPGAGWNVPPTPNGYVTFTTPPLARDAEILGSGNADLWLTSTATDTDLQITLSEVRPDGQEAYLQRGWLRASHRKEDPAHSTLLRPLQTHRAADARELVPGQPAHMRVELFPVGHVFRKGSSIRLIVDAPTGLVGDWELNFLNTPAINTVLHDAAHPSRLVLSLVDGSAYARLPACGVVKYEPCRPSIAPVPNGSLTP
jgi:putative CocE/NonD family hydrolase